MECVLCPHRCHVDRAAALGICRAPARPKVAQAQLHFYEEPCLSGTRGSGTVFFSHCNLRCRFCQNYDISQLGHGRVIDVARLAEIYLELQARGAHNINLVSPTPYTDIIRESLTRCRDRLTIPVVWNSNGYENVETLRTLVGMVGIFLPDLKYCDDRRARSFSGAPDYFSHATAAILEMRRQVPDDELDADGIMRRGLIIRHLVLPGSSGDSRAVLTWIREHLGRRTMVSLMAQYYPAYQAAALPGLNRRLTPREYAEVRDYFLALGFEDGFVQDTASATPDCTPRFRGDGVSSTAP